MKAFTKFSDYDMFSTLFIKFIYNFIIFHIFRLEYAQWHKHIIWNFLMKSIIHHIGKEILGIYFGGFLTFDAALLINSPEYRIWRQLIFISHFDNSKVIKLLLYHYPGEHERTAVNQLCIKNSFTIFPGIQFLN